MNLDLDRLIRRIVREPAFLGELEGVSPDTLGVRVTQEEITLLTDKDLAGLREHGAHPLLLMQLASAFRIEPMPILAEKVSSPPLNEVTCPRRSERGSEE